MYSVICHPVCNFYGSVFFFKQKTAYEVRISDWSSDVFSSDLASTEARRAARSERNDSRRYRHGHVVVEAKRWGRPLDRGDSSNPLDTGTPSSQMLRYLSRAAVVSDETVQWGILTNGRQWRLYWQGARSRSEEFLQFDLAE